MKTAKQRYDFARIKAMKDDNGFLYDTPIVARIGLQTYVLPDGSLRREFRPASEVFRTDSLASYQGKPITLGHKDVDASNAKEVMVGACTGHAYRDYEHTLDGIKEGVGVRCPITVHDGDAIEQAESGEAAELSVGYTTIDIDSPGWGNNKTGEYVLDGAERDARFDSIDFESSPDWVRFDAIQTNITVNHVAMVFRGRAGIAKLNLDSEQEFPYIVETETNKEDEEEMTVKIKIDSVEVEVSKDVAEHIESLKAKADEAVAKADSLEAERDSLKAEVEAIPAKIEEAVKEAKAEAEAHAELVAVAEEAGVKADGLSDKEIKVAYVKEVTGADIAEKSDAYIDVAFDLAKASDKMAAQRIAAKGDAEDKHDSADVLNPNARLAKLSK